MWLHWLARDCKLAASRRVDAVVSAVRGELGGSDARPPASHPFARLGVIMRFFSGERAPCVPVCSTCTRISGNENLDFLFMHSTIQCIFFNWIFRILPFSNTNINYLLPYMFYCTIFYQIIIYFVITQNAFQNAVIYPFINIVRLIDW